jgi:hypothetical protein
MCVTDWCLDLRAGIIMTVIIILWIIPICCIDILPTLPLPYLHILLEYNLPDPFLSHWISQHNHG